MTDPEPSRSQAKRLAAQGKPPETSRELVLRVREYSGTSHLLTGEDAAALIDAYVLERKSKLLEVFAPLLDDLRHLKRMAETCDMEGLIATPQKEWTPYQGKIIAYEYCISHLESVLDAARASLRDSGRAQPSPREKPR